VPWRRWTALGRPATLVRAGLGPAGEVRSVGTAVAGQLAADRGRLTADLPGDLGLGAALSPELGDDFPVEERKVASVHRKAPGSRLLPANNNLPNRPCDATFSPALRLRVESAEEKGPIWRFFGRASPDAGRGGRGNEGR